MKVEKLVEEINKNFKVSWMPDDFVSAAIRPNGDFVLKIGERDLQLRSNGDFVGSGRDVSKGGDSFVAIVKPYKEEKR